MPQPARIVADLSAGLLRDSKSALDPTSAADLETAWRSSVRLFLLLLTHSFGEHAERDEQTLSDSPGESHVSRPALLSAEKAARWVAGESPSPHAAISRTYQELLRYDLGWNGDAVTLQRARKQRKKTGVFYTPDTVARRLAEEALRPVADIDAPTVLDPAMGTGTLLLAAVHHLAEQGVRGGDSAAIAEDCLFGLDIDPLAVELAIASLSLETGARSQVLAAHLRCGDFLADNEPLSDVTIDTVISNPPWGASYDVATQLSLKRRFPGATCGSFDSFKLFLDRASQLSRWTVGMVVPQAMLAQERHTDIRTLLLQRCFPVFGSAIADDSFPGAAAPACLLVFGTRSAPLRPGDSAGTTCTDTWTPKGFWPSGRPVGTLLLRLQERHPVLGDLCQIYRVRDTGINYNRATVAHRIFYEGDRPHDSRDVARYRGRNFTRYSAIEPGGWLRHNAAEILAPGETLSLDWLTYRRREKIVLRQTADRLVATLDRSQMALGRSVIAITTEAEGSLCALLACVNSRLLTALYRALAGEAGRVLPQVKVGRLLALPLPAVSVIPITPEERGRARTMLEAGEQEALLAGVEGAHALGWASLEYLAERLLPAEHPCSPDFPCLQGESVCALDAEALIDRIVYSLYDLTPEEVSLVERDAR